MLEIIYNLNVPPLTVYRDSIVDWFEKGTTS